MTAVYKVMAYIRDGCAGAQREIERMPEETFVSFVIIAYNEEANIACTIASICALEELGHYEVIVVDDGSRDKTARIVADIADGDPRVRLIAFRGKTTAGVTPEVRGSRLHVAG